MKSTNKRINLDWSKLTGFNQVKAAKTGNGRKPNMAKIGAKVGAKVGLKARA